MSKFIIEPVCYNDAIFFLKNYLKEKTKWIPGAIHLGILSNRKKVSS